MASKHKPIAKPGSRSALVAAAAALIAAPVTQMNSTAEALAADSIIVEAKPKAGKSKLRTYQIPLFQDQHTKVLLVECSRQIGKSHTMGEWAAFRLLRKLQQDDVNEWLIVLISNSQANGVELGGKVAAALRRAKESQDELKAAAIDLETPSSIDTARDPELGHQEGVPDLEVHDFAQRIEIRIGNKRGRVLVLAASPRTARGFSADLGLDEFAFHMNAPAIWDAAYPMLDSNPEFVCRICSTHNGLNSLFNTWIRGKVFPTYSIKRSEAWAMGRGEPAAMEHFYEKWAALGPRNKKQADAWRERHGLTPQPWDKLKILSLRTQDAEGNQRELTPAEAEAEATDKISYRQNYENDPADAGGSFLDLAWIVNAARPGGPVFTVDTQTWTDATLQRLYRLKEQQGTFWVGKDFARTTDLSVDNVLWEDTSGDIIQVAQLESRNKNTPAQFHEMCRLMEVIGPRTGRVTLDATGNGLGLAEFLQEKYASLILLVNYSETVEMDSQLQAEGRREKTMLIGERMAVDLASLFETGRIRILNDASLIEDLRKPCRVYKNGKVYLAAARTPDDHADRFQSLALANHGRISGAFGAWTAEHVAGAEVGHCPVRTLPAFTGFNPDPFPGHSGHLVW